MQISRDEDDDVDNNKYLCYETLGFFLLLLAFAKLFLKKKEMPFGHLGDDDQDDGNNKNLCDPI